MSRIGKVPITLPQGVKFSISPEMVVRVTGPKGELSTDTRGHVTVREKDGQLVVERHSDEKEDKAFHGLYHRLITNALAGVTQGYQRSLEIQGVGYKAAMRGQELVLNVGRSHEFRYLPPAGITIQVPTPTQINFAGIDKQAVHQAAAQVRAMCPPEPYKGKGIRYAGEAVKRKVGKTGAK